VKKPIPFGKYMLLERVNVGGMAEVFKAKAFGVEGFERLVAVKRILPSIAEDTEFITMFIDEAKIAVQLTHANIAQIFDLGKVGDSYFIAMEFVHGKDLRAIFDRSRKRGEPLPVPMACYVIMKVCEGLDYAHNKKDPAGRDLNLVHRDVSPQNVLLSYDGEVKIIDFGIAKAAGKAGKTQAGILKGKFGYMSPEQVRGLPLDRKSDIFAMGICLYELLTGERLFVGESDFSTLEKVRNVEIMPPSTYNRRIPEELEQIVLKALAKDVDDRYQTAMDLHDDLQSFMYTSGNFFARKDLSGYMRKSFADEIAKESARDEEYRRLDSPGSSGLDAFDDLEPAEAPRDRPHAAAAPPAANLSQPGPPRRGAPKRTMMGMGAAPPMPPGGRTSGPPPPPPPRNSRPGVPKPVPDMPTPSPDVPAANAGPTLDMDWDDEELSTQIYDKPDGGGGYAGPGAPPFGDSPPRPVRTTNPGIAPAAGPPRTNSNPMFAAAGPPQPRTSSNPMFPAAGPPRTSGPPAPPAGSGFASPTPSPPRLGAPSPFEDPAPAAPARPVGREPTALTRAEKKGGRAALGVVVALLALVVLAGGGVGAWWFFLGGKNPGTIHLTTTPGDPVVLFDEQPVPALSSPFVIRDVEPGVMHLLEVSKPGFRTWSMQVELDPGETMELPPVTLQADTGAGAAVAGTGFTLDTEPSGAKVFVDGRELEERTPVQVVDLSPGDHTIRVEKGAHFAPWQMQINVREGQVQALPRAVLQQQGIMVRFRSEPRGGDVVLLRGRERREIGSTPTSAEIELGGDPWRVEISRDGYETHRQDLSPPRGEEEFEVSVELESRAVAVAPRPTGGTPRVQRQPRERRGGAGVASGGTGTLRVNTRPWSQVFVDGRLIGNTPQMNIPLPAGTHRLTLVNSDFNIRETRTVTIRAGETETQIVTLNPG